MFATFLFGIGSMLIFAMTSTMLTEFLPNRSSSGVALAILTRNLLGCIGAIVASPFIDAIGNGWVFTILALICYASAGVILAIKIFGNGWRKSMDHRLA
jgi:MFS family permease